MSDDEQRTDPRAYAVSTRPALEYHLGYAHVRRLRSITLGTRERDALDRLEAFRGTEADMLTAASMYERAGDKATAAELVRVLPEHLRPTAT